MLEKNDINKLDHVGLPTREAFYAYAKQCNVLYGLLAPNIPKHVAIDSSYNHALQHLPQWCVWYSGTCHPIYLKPMSSAKPVNLILPVYLYCLLPTLFQLVIWHHQVSAGMLCCYDKWNARPDHGSEHALYDRVRKRDGLCVFAVSSNMLRLTVIIHPEYNPNADPTLHRICGCNKSLRMGSNATTTCISTWMFGQTYH